jgi:asparagine synthase (glutamine-hydrolysing)
MRHRGPDGEGICRIDEHEIVLEHVRLAIIDPDNREADQPFSDPTGRWVLVFNGEIFNFRELRGRLERRGVRFRTDSDTEVVLQSFIADGEMAFTTFRGMFALVIADRQTGELVVARDQIGVKPLYWSLRAGLFVAASEMRTMLAHPAAHPRLDHAGVVRYLACGHTGGERTLIDGVQQLPPGHGLRVRDGRCELFEYWDIVPAAAGPAPHNGTGDLLELLDEAVAASLVSDVPVSLMLSGGMDSATIAALAVRHVDPRELTAYSVSFGLPNDESAAAARLAGDLGMPHREISLTRENLADGFAEWLRGLDVPCANPTWIAVSHIARAVREDGGKVLLGGDGGDELFGGYERWMKYLRFHEQVWRRTPRRLRHVGGRAAQPFTSGLAKDISRRAREDGDLFVGSRLFHDDDLVRYLGPRGRAAIAAESPEHAVADLRRRFDATHPTGDYLAWMSYAMLKTHLAEDFLARLDKMGMAESVEGRVPLLDPVLAAWAFRVPQAEKVPGYRSKAMFRQAAQPLLPRYITERPKQGFCPPVADWAAALIATRSDELGILAEEGLVAPDALARLAREPSANASFALWSLGTLTAWCSNNL